MHSLFDSIGSYDEAPFGTVMVPQGDFYDMADPVILALEKEILHNVNVALLLLLSLSEARSDTNGEDDGVVSLVYSLYRTLEKQGYLLAGQKALNEIRAPEALYEGWLITRILPG
ncbi:hypothetical protein KQI65_15925 [bacterium]|nr:hypothetical protein [bacterium]